MLPVSIWLYCDNVVYKVQSKINICDLANLGDKCITNTTYSGLSDKEKKDTSSN